MVRRVCLHRPDYEFTARRGQIEAEVSPPSCSLLRHTHTHFGNRFFTGQLPCDLCQPTHAHTHLSNYGQSKGMITVTVEQYTHTQPVMMRIHTPQPLQRHKIWHSLSEGHSSTQLQHSNTRDTKTIRLPVHIWHRFPRFTLFKPTACSNVRFTHTHTLLLSFNFIKSDYFLIIISTLIHLLGRTSL